ncbi:hypothetical protein QJS04_geneDACA013705 [Acorus gramineus]|uniref:Protein POLAR LOCALIZATION DURING ASYMMETRIC DIVISION AND REDISTRIBUTION-like n=1 Tax=Acorus gramineus TaxID=55184 RepID=A0AAV9AZM8_ACOGR|nr:hypothetical protein QJS04_geneDACA013705 [Acorus gramineus]
MCGEIKAVVFERKRNECDMRILDFLKENDVEMPKKSGRVYRIGGGFGSASLPSSPRLVLSWLFSSLKPKKERLDTERQDVLVTRALPDTKNVGLDTVLVDRQAMIVGCDQAEVGGEAAGGDVPHNLSLLPLEEHNGREIISNEDGSSNHPSSSESIVSLAKNGDVSSNLPIGAGLVFLIAKGITEFNKMLELRNEMEVLLKEIKEEVRRKTDNSPNADSNLACSASSLNGYKRERDHPPVQNLIDITDPVRHSNCEASLMRVKSLRMVQLEEELEAELERLQINLDLRIDSELPENRMEIAVENTAPDQSMTASFEEEEDPHAPDSRDTTGVCPHELERRLHELLEAQQRERISELESALQSTENRLHEKEMEISWWRDTARVFSKDKQKLPCLSADSRDD